jgi:MFS family permease
MRYCPEYRVVTRGARGMSFSTKSKQRTGSNKMQLQGNRIGGCNAMVYVLRSDLTPLMVRGLYLGVIQLTAALGLVASIMMVAAFWTLSTRRLIFWINFPICVISAAGVFFLVPPLGSSVTAGPIAEELR